MGYSSLARAGFRGDIQGLRAVGVLAVVMYHVGVPGFSGGYAGVDVFFVISGFLITSHLWGSLAADGRIGLASFFARRARRLLPVSLFVTGVTACASAVWLSPLRSGGILQDSLASLRYVPNLLFARRGTDYLAETAPSPFQHYWSLGVEEQFYLLWPFVLVGLAFIARRRLGGVTARTAALVVISLGWGLYLTGTSPSTAFFLLPSRAWELGVGALLALATAWRPILFESRVWSVVGWFGLAAVLGAFVVLDDRSRFPGTAALAPVLGAAAVIAAGISERVRSGELGSLLSFRPLVWIGTISYSLYLVHWPMLIIPLSGNTETSLMSRALLGLLSVPIAYLVHRYIEQVGLRGRWLAVGRPRRTLVATVVATVFTGGLVVSAASAGESRPLSTDVVVPAYVVATNPEGADVVGANLRPSLAEASTAIPSIYATGCHRANGSVDSTPCVFGSGTLRIALFGDSHAAQWFPALNRVARTGEFTLESYTKSSCSSVPSTQSSPDCKEWREGVIGSLAADPPGIIVVSNFVHGAFATADEYRLALEQLVDLLPHGELLVVIADTPRNGSTPALCLSLHVEDAKSCAVSRELAVSADFVTAEREVAPVIDLTGYLCNSEVCPAILGDILVYRDAHHLTPDMSEALAPVLFGEIMEIADGGGVDVAGDGD